MQAITFSLISIMVKSRIGKEDWIGMIMELDIMMRQ